MDGSNTRATTTAAAPTSPLFSTSRFSRGSTSSSSIFAPRRWLYNDPDNPDDGDGDDGDDDDGDDDDDDIHDDNQHTAIGITDVSTDDGADYDDYDDDDDDQGDYSRVYSLPFSTHRSNRNRHLSNSGSRARHRNRPLRSTSTSISDDNRAAPLSSVEIDTHPLTLSGLIEGETEPVQDQGQANDTISTAQRVAEARRNVLDAAATRRSTAAERTSGTSRTSSSRDRIQATQQRLASSPFRRSLHLDSLAHSSPTLYSSDPLAHSSPTLSSSDPLAHPSAEAHTAPTLASRPSSRATTTTASTVASIFAGLGTRRIDSPSQLALRRPRTPALRDGPPSSSTAAFSSSSAAMDAPRSSSSSSSAAKRSFDQAAFSPSTSPLGTHQSPLAAGLSAHDPGEGSSSGAGRRFTAMAGSSSSRPSSSAAAPTAGDATTTRTGSAHKRHCSASRHGRSSHSRRGHRRLARRMSITSAMDLSSPEGSASSDTEADALPQPQQPQHSAPRRCPWARTSNPRPRPSFPPALGLDPDVVERPDSPPSVLSGFAASILGSPPFLGGDASVNTQGSADAGAVSSAHVTSGSPAAQAASDSASSTNASMALAATNGSAVTASPSRTVSPQSMHARSSRVSSSSSNTRSAPRSHTSASAAQDLECYLAELHAQIVQTRQQLPRRGIPFDQAARVSDADLSLRRSQQEIGQLRRTLESARDSILRAAALVGREEDTATVEHRRNDVQRPSSSSIFARPDSSARPTSTSRSASSSSTLLPSFASLRRRREDHQARLREMDEDTSSSSRARYRPTASHRPTPRASSPMYRLTNDGHGHGDGNGDGDGDGDGSGASPSASDDDLTGRVWAHALRGESLLDEPSSSATRRGTAGDDGSGARPSLRHRALSRAEQALSNLEARTARPSSREDGTEDILDESLVNRILEQISSELSPALARPIETPRGRHTELAGSSSSSSSAPSAAQTTTLPPSAFTSHRRSRIGRNQSGARTSSTSEDALQVPRLPIVRSGSPLRMPFGGSGGGGGGDTRRQDIFTERPVAQVPPSLGGPAGTTEASSSRTTGRPLRPLNLSSRATTNTTDVASPAEARIPPVRTAASPRPFRVLAPNNSRNTTATDDGRDALWSPYTSLRRRPPPPPPAAFGEEDAEESAAAMPGEDMAHAAMFSYALPTSSESAFHGPLPRVYQPLPPMLSAGSSGRRWEPLDVSRLHSQERQELGLDNGRSGSGGGSGGGGGSSSSSSNDVSPMDTVDDELEREYRFQGLLSGAALNRPAFTLSADTSHRSADASRREAAATTSSTSSALRRPILLGGGGDHHHHSQASASPSAAANGEQTANMRAVRERFRLMLEESQARLAHAPWTTFRNASSSPSAQQGEPSSISGRARYGALVDGIGGFDPLRHSRGVRASGGNDAFASASASAQQGGVGGSTHSTIASASSSMGATPVSGSSVLPRMATPSERIRDHDRFLEVAFGSTIGPRRTARQAGSAGRTTAAAAGSQAGASSGAAAGATPTHRNNFPFDAFEDVLWHERVPDILALSRQMADPARPRGAPRSAIESLTSFTYASRCGERVRRGTGSGSGSGSDDKGEGEVASRRDKGKGKAKARDVGAGSVEVVEILDSEGEDAVMPASSASAGSSSSAAAAVAAAVEPPSDDTSNISETCPICLDDYLGTDLLVESWCKHVFHETCLKSWLESASTCPMCRQQPPPAPASSSSRRGERGERVWQGEDFLAEWAQAGSMPTGAGPSAGTSAGAASTAAAAARLGPHELTAHPMLGLDALHHPLHHGVPHGAAAQVGLVPLAHVHGHVPHARGQGQAHARDSVPSHTNPWLLPDSASISIIDLTAESGSGPASEPRFAFASASGHRHALDRHEFGYGHGHGHGDARAQAHALGLDFAYAGGGGGVGSGAAAESASSTGATQASGRSASSQGSE